MTDERKAAEQALTVTRALVPLTPRTDPDISVIRNAAQIATNAIKGLSSQVALDEARGKAATILVGVSGSLGTPMLVQELIDHANSAVSKWLRELAVSEE
jgi:hypothetical protein